MFVNWKNMFSTTNWLIQGFSTFWYSRTPKSKLYPSAYPHPLPYPQIKNSTQISFNWVRFFEFCVPLWALCVPSVASSRTPRGYAYRRLRTAGLINYFSICFRWRVWSRSLAPGSASGWRTSGSCSTDRESCSTAPLRNSTWKRYKIFQNKSKIWILRMKKLTFKRFR
jgi:hypothetical protein